MTEEQRTLPAGPGVACELHAYHSPEVASFDEHHIVPRADGGPDRPTNMLVVCPTGHRNLHVLLAQMKRGTARRGDWGAETWYFASRGLR